MAAPTDQIPAWLQIVNGLAPYLAPITTGVVSGFVGFYFGRAKSEHDLKIEKERLEYQRELETEKALREERRLKVTTWRHEISNYTSVVTKLPDRDKHTVFNLESFVRTEAYLSLRGYLTESQQTMTEAIPKTTMTAAEYVNNLRPRLPQYATPLKVRDMLLARIGELEKEWELT